MQRFDTQRRWWILNLSRNARRAPPISPDLPNVSRWRRGTSSSSNQAVRSGSLAIRTSSQRVHARCAARLSDTFDGFYRSSQRSSEPSRISDFYILPLFVSSSSSLAYFCIHGLAASSKKTDVLRGIRIRSSPICHAAPSDRPHRPQLGDH